MRVRTTITIHDTLTPQQRAKLAGFLLDLAPTIVGPTSIQSLDELVRVRWFTEQGTVVEAAAMWYPMLLGCWVHIDRSLESSQISEVQVIQETAP